MDRLNAEFGVNFLLPADEYFVKAVIPEAEKYGIKKKDIIYILWEEQYAIYY